LAAMRAVAHPRCDAQNRLDEWTHSTAVREALACASPIPSSVQRRLGDSPTTGQRQLHGQRSVRARPRAAGFPWLPPAKASLAARGLSLALDDGGASARHHRAASAIAAGLLAAGETPWPLGLLEGHWKAIGGHWVHAIDRVLIACQRGVLLLPHPDVRAPNFFFHGAIG